MSCAHEAMGRVWRFLFAGGISKSTPGIILALRQKQMRIVGQQVNVLGKRIAVFLIKAGMPSMIAQIPDLDGNPQLFFKYLPSWNLVHDVIGDEYRLSHRAYATDRPISPVL
jgi:hypothetical protein